MSAVNASCKSHAALTDFKIMLIWQSVVDFLYESDFSQDLLAHLVHGVLHTWTFILGKSLHGDGTCRLPRLIEDLLLSLDRVKSLECLPLPAGVDCGTQDSILSLWKDGILVLGVETIESGTSTLENEEAFNARANGDALVSTGDGFYDPGVLAVAKERVRMRLSIDGHASPTVLDDAHVNDMDVFVLVDEMVAKGRGKQLRRKNGILLGEDVGGLLLGVCRDDDRVVCFSVGGLNISFELGADSKLGNILCAGNRVFVDFKESHVVFAILGVL